jgi:uncharacterized membrane protein
MVRDPWIRRLVLAAAAGELVVDKLPGTPGRLAPRGIFPRLALRALAASLSAQTRQVVAPRGRPRSLERGHRGQTRA